MHETILSADLLSDPLHVGTCPGGNLFGSRKRAKTRSEHGKILKGSREMGPMHLERLYTHSAKSFTSNLGPLPHNWLAPEKGVHQFRFFLPTMRTPNSIAVCSRMHAFLWKWDPMHTPSRTSVYALGAISIKMHICMSRQQ